MADPIQRGTWAHFARCGHLLICVGLPLCSDDPEDESTHAQREATQRDLVLPVTVPIGTSDLPHERHAAAGARRRVSDTIRRGTSVAGVVGPNPLMKLPGMDRHRDRVDAALTAAVAAEDELMAQMGGHLIEAGGKRARPLFAVASAAVLATSPEGTAAAATADGVLGGVPVQPG